MNDETIRRIMVFSPIAWISASLLETLALYPLDVALTRRQSSPVYVPARSASSIIARLYHNRALYHGFIPHLASNFPLLSIRSWTASRFDIKQNPLPIAALTGAVTGLVEGIVITPFESLKVPMQITDSKMTLRDSFNALTMNGTNYRPLFRGFLPTISRQCVYGAITFSSVKLLGNMQDRDVASGATLLAFSTIISATAAIGGSPLDVIKTRSQSLLQFPPITKRHLFAGLSIKLWRVTLGTCAVLMTYDEIARLLERAEVSA